MLRSLGLASDLLILRGQSQVEVHPDRVVLRTPSEPDYWFGNMVIFKTGQVAPEAQIAQFRADFPGVPHIVLCWDAPDQAHAPGHAALQDLGFALEETDVLARFDPLPPRPVPAGITLRPISGDADWAQVLALQIETGIEEGYVPEIHNPFLKRRLTTRRAQIAQGQGQFRGQFRGQWFGAFDDGLLVADLGIFTDGQLARYQSVQTRASHRRQGLARALLIEASQWAKTKAPDAQLVILADQDNPSAQIYRRAGFDLKERLIAAVKAPEGAKVSSDP